MSIGQAISKMPKIAKWVIAFVLAGVVILAIANFTDCGTEVADEAVPVETFPPIDDEPGSLTGDGDCTTGAVMTMTNAETLDLVLYHCDDNNKWVKTEVDDAEDGEDD